LPGKKASLKSEFMDVLGIIVLFAILAAAFGFGCFLLYKAFKGLKTGSIAPWRGRWDYTKPKSVVTKAENKYRFWFSVVACMVLGLILTVGLAGLFISVYLTTGAI
jgi:hypothetical protein